MPQIQRRSVLAGAIHCGVLLSLLEVGACQAASEGRPHQTVPSVGIEMLSVKWGSEPGNLGRSLPEESNPEGPMSFAIDDGGAIFILDQINQRVQRFDGHGTHAGTIPLSTQTYKDLDLDSSGQLVLLDPWRYEAVVFVDDSGQPTASVDLLGPGIPEVGGVVGIRSLADGVWVGYGEGMVRVCDPEGHPDPDRPLVDGTLSSDGRFVLKVAREGEGTARVTRRKAINPEVHGFSASFDLPILHITLIDTDASGKTYLGVNLLEDGAEPPFGPDEAREEVVVFDVDGKETRRVILPVSTLAEEVTRSIRVSADGTVYQLIIGETGATLWRYDP